MERYAWDVDHIKRRYEYFKNLIETTDDVQKKIEYEDLYCCYSFLLQEICFSDGISVSNDMSKMDVLMEIREYPVADDYPDYSLKIRDNIIKQMYSLVMDLPYVRFSKSMNDKNLVNYIGEAIHDIFGDAAYEDYKKMAIDTNSKIQIGNSESQAYVYPIDDPEYPDYYVMLPRQKNMSIVRDLVHEAGHYHRLCVNDSKLLENHLLLEYGSFSYELRVLDYFIKNGIYKREAIKAMIRSINLIDSCALLFNELDILESKTVNEFTRKAHERGLYDRIHIPNNELLFDYLFTVKTEYLFPYIYSVLNVFDHMKTDSSLDRYETVIHNIGRMPGEELIKEVVDKPEDINNLNEYRKYREDIKKLYKGE